MAADAFEAEVVITLGVDISSYSVDVVLLRPSLPPLLWSARVADKGDPGTERSFRAACRAAKAMRRSRLFGDVIWKAEAAFIERPFSQGYRATASLMRMQGVVLSALPTEIEKQELPPQTWKRLIGLKATASKDDVAAWAHDAYAPWVDGWSQDALDALGIARAGREILLDRKAAA